MFRFMKRHPIITVIVTIGLTLFGLSVVFVGQLLKESPEEPMGI